MSKYPIALVLFTLSVPSFANESQHLIDATMKSCLDNAMTTVSIRDCYNQAYKAWDTELNKQYSLIMKTLDLNGEQKAALRNSQREWLTYRDSYFKALQSYYPAEGTIWGIIYDEQVMQIVRDKALSLAKLRKSQCLAGPDECE